MARGQSTRLQYFAQRNAFRLFVIGAKQGRLKAIQPRNFFFAGKLGMVSNVVSNANEFVERQNDRPVPPLD
jgi:hypothetical protein